MTAEKIRVDASIIIETYLIEIIPWWKNKQYSGKILDSQRKIHFDIRDGLIKDDLGGVNWKFREVSSGLFNPWKLDIYDSLDQYLGAIVSTRQRVKKGMVKKGIPAQYSLLNAHDQVLALAEPSDTERLLPHYSILALDGRSYAEVHQTESEGFFQVDILQSGLHPRIVLLYVCFKGNPTIVATN